MNFRELQELSTAYNKVHESQEIEELYKGKHGQSEKEYADSRSQGGKMVSGDSKQSGAEYTHGRRVKAANPGMQPDVGGKTKPKSQGKMDRGTRADLEYRKANLKKEELDIFDVVLEFLQTEGYAETLEEAEWMMANIIDEEAIDIILGEAKVDAGLSPLQKIRKRNKAYSIPGEPAGQQTSNRRAERSSTRGQKKERGAKSAFGTMRNVGGPYKEEYVGEDYVNEADSIAKMRERAAKRREQRYGKQGGGGRDDFRPYTKDDYERGEKKK